MIERPKLVLLFRIKNAFPLVPKLETTEAEKALKTELDHLPGVQNGAFLAPVHQLLYKI